MAPSSADKGDFGAVASKFLLPGRKILEIEVIHDGDEPYLPLSAPISFEDGTMLKSPTAFGQSVCVMVRR